MSLKSRRELLSVTAPRYQTANKKQKQQILDGVSTANPNTCSRQVIWSVQVDRLALGSRQPRESDYEANTAVYAGEYRACLSERARQSL